MERLIINIRNSDSGRNCVAALTDTIWVHTLICLNTSDSAEISPASGSKLKLSNIVFRIITDAVPVRQNLKGCTYDEFPSLKNESITCRGSVNNEETVWIYFVRYDNAFGLSVCDVETRIN